MSADADFGTLIAVRSSPQPSVIQFRGEASRKPDALAPTLLANLPQLIDALENGSIVTFEPARVRVRLLPLGRAGATSRSNLTALRHADQVSPVLRRHPEDRAILHTLGWYGEVFERQTDRCMGKSGVINRSEASMRRPGDTQTPAPGGRVAARRRQFLEQRSGEAERPPRRLTASIESAERKNRKKK